MLLGVSKTVVSLLIAFPLVSYSAELNIPNSTLAPSPISSGEHFQERDPVSDFDGGHEQAQMQAQFDLDFDSWEDFYNKKKREMEGMYPHPLTTCDVICSQELLSEGKESAFTEGDQGDPCIAPTASEECLRRYCQTCCGSEDFSSTALFGKTGNHFSGGDMGQNICVLVNGFKGAGWNKTDVSTDRLVKNTAGFNFNWTEPVEDRDSVNGQVAPSSDLKDPEWGVAGSFSSDSSALRTNFNPSVAGAQFISIAEETLSDFRKRHQDNTSVLSRHAESFLCGSGNSEEQDQPSVVLGAWEIAAPPCFSLTEGEGVFKKVASLGAIQPEWDGEFIVFNDLELSDLITATHYDTPGFSLYGRSLGADFGADVDVKTASNLSPATTENRVEVSERSAGLKTGWGDDGVAHPIRIKNMKDFWITQRWVTQDWIIKFSPSSHSIQSYAELLSVTDTILRPICEERDRISEYLDGLDSLLLPNEFTEDFTVKQSKIKSEGGVFHRSLEELEHSVIRKLYEISRNLNNGTHFVDFSHFSETTHGSSFSYDDYYETLLKEKIIEICGDKALNSILQ